MSRPTSGLSMQQAAYCAAAWASGETQKSLAQTFGHKKTVQINLAIREFLDAFAPPAAVHELAAKVHAARLRYRHVTHYPPHSLNVIWDATNVGDAQLYGENRKALVPEALMAFQRWLPRAPAETPRRGRPKVEPDTGQDGGKLQPGRDRGEVLPPTEG